MIEIRQARNNDIPAVQKLWREYWKSLGLAADFQHFEEECATLPGVYGSPGGRLLLARLDGRVAGTVALRPLHSDDPQDPICEAKRLYVRPEFRGRGVGKALLARLIAEARIAGYRAMYGDTLPSMDADRGLYQESGFVEVEAYSPEPTPGAVYLGRDI